MAGGQREMLSCRLTHYLKYEVAALIDPCFIRVILLKLLKRVLLGDVVALKLRVEIIHVILKNFFQLKAPAPTREIIRVDQ